MIKRLFAYVCIGLIIIFALDAWAIPPTTDILQRPGGMKCKFFDKSLELVEDKILYWHQLLDIDSRKMVFKSEGGVYTLSYDNPNPWICIPISDPD